MSRWRPVSPREYVDGLNNGLPKPEMGPPNGSFTWDHPMGVAPRTGEDNLAYWLYGCRVSLLIATTATLIASTVGIVIGLLAGFIGGTVDKVLSFFIDMFLTIPFLLAALTLAPILNERFNSSDNYPTIQKVSLVAVLSLFGWMGTARLIRGEVLSLREREFVQAARVMGMPTSRILFKELLPNLAAPIIISVSLMLPAFVAARGGARLPRHRRHRRHLVGPDDPQGAGLLQDLSAVPVAADARHHRPGAVPQPAGRRDPRRPRPQDPTLARRSHFVAGDAVLGENR